jgi:hypothetical protein
MFSLAQLLLYTLLKWGSNEVIIYRNFSSYGINRVQSPQTRHGNSSS